MKKGRLIEHERGGLSLEKNSHYTIQFDESELGPYSYIFDRERLYYDENLEERGSYLFPLKDSIFDNTEIFIERNDIVIALGERGSFSGESRIFMEIVNLKNGNKYRLYPDEVSLIYNSKENIVIYFKKGAQGKKLELSIDSLEKISETTQHLSAFFKLYYNHTNQSYGRLVYKANSHSHMAGYFTEEKLVNTKVIKQDIKWLDMVHHDEPTGFHTGPKQFIRKEFILKTDSDQKIDVWEASLTGEL